MTTTTSSTIDREPWTVDCRNVADHAVPPMPEPVPWWAWVLRGL